jgi:hypothetical protein
MSYSYGRRGSRTAYDGTRSQSAGSLVLATGSYEEQGQLVEDDDTGNDNGERYRPSGNEPCHRPILRDHRVKTYDACNSRRAIEWTVTELSDGAENSQQVARIDRNEDEYEGDDENNRNDSETDDEYHRRDRRCSSKRAEQPSRRDPRNPPIAKFVRSQAQRKSSYGRALFSPSALQNGETAMTRYGAVEFPLLPIWNHHSPPSLSQAALEFADINSGEFHLCIRFLGEHESLLHENYHAYLQEAWKALWDGEKPYAHQCLSRWFLLDECRQIWPRDIGKHINQRTFSGSDFLDKVDDMYRTLKRLRQDVLGEMAQAARGQVGDGSQAKSSRPFSGVWGLVQGVDRAKVLSNIGTVCRLVRDVSREL